jgi:hypothetical protein
MYLEKQMRKIKITERKETEYFGNFDGMTLEEIQNRFDAFIERYKLFPDTVEIEQDGYSDSSYNLVGLREENLTEKARRETSERRKRVQAGERKKAKEAEERKEYERLKKKFGE